MLLLSGDNDRTVPPRISADLAARLRASGRPVRERCLEGLGHLMHEEAPERVAGEIGAFLGDG
jgi:magnesium chelatase accessory protein